MRIDWPAHALTAARPSDAELAAVAPALAAAYNDPHNAPLLGHTEALAVADVLDHYAAAAHPFVLYRDGAFAGDADLRDVAGGRAEFAFLIADPGAQGRGLGTRFAIMIHAYAFEVLGLDRVVASVLPANVASRRVFARLGYAPATAVDAEVGDPGDVVLAIDRATFLAAHPVGELVFTPARRGGAR